MFNQTITIFIICYLKIIIGVFPHIHFYESYFFIYKSKLSNYCFRYIHIGITITDVVLHFANKVPKSSISELINFRGLPEAFQHARTGTKLISENSDICYLLSRKGYGYDALAFNYNNLKIILEQENTNLVELYEKKMMFGTSSWTLSKILKFFKTYSVPNVEGLEANKGVRPFPIDQLEIGATTKEGYNHLISLDVPILNKPSIIFEDYSDVYVKLVWNSKHGCLAGGTIISDWEFEHLKYFCYLLDKNEELWVHMNSILEENPYFPL